LIGERKGGSQEAAYWRKSRSGKKKVTALGKGAAKNRLQEWKKKDQAKNFHRTLRKLKGGGVFREKRGWRTDFLPARVRGERRRKNRGATLRKYQADNQRAANSGTKWRAGTEVKKKGTKKFPESIFPERKRKGRAKLGANNAGDDQEFEKNLKNAEGPIQTAKGDDSAKAGGRVPWWYLNEAKFLKGRKRARRNFRKK